MIYMDWSSLPIYNKVLPLTPQHAQTLPWLDYSLLAICGVLRLSALLSIYRVLERHWILKQGRKTMIQGWEGQSSRVEAEGQKGQENSLLSGMGISRGRMMTHRTWIQGSEALNTWTGSSDVVIPAQHQGTTTFLNLDSFSLSACLKQSMKPSLSHTQIAAMLEIPGLAFIRLTCFLQMQISFVLTKYFWI